MKKFSIIFLGLSLILILILVVTGDLFVDFTAKLNMTNTPKTRITEQPMSRSDYIADFGNTNLPVSASNIWIASSSVGMGGRARLYRFDAPYSDCLAYAAQLIRRSNSNSDSNHQASTELLTISDPPSPIQSRMMQAYGLETLDWFDVETVRNGFTGRGPPLGLSSFWIDTDRNRFYYYWTD